jgi:hypothetical protein
VRIGGKRSKWHFTVKVMPPGFLPDLLEPAAVKAFLEATHDLYKIHVGSEFGKTVPGAFTDEPQYTTHHTVNREKALPWTEHFPEEFEKDHGYSVLDHLGSLFFDVGAFMKVRYHFFSTVTRLYLEAYSKQIYDWCEENRLKYTGHYEWEDSFLGQIHCIGSAMQHYEYMQQPGIDHLGRGIHNPWVEKQVTSVASQLGKERVLSETYGVSGQSLSFHDRRWIGNWPFALGVNFLNHHLSLYSLRGARKRDYPPTLTPHQPWWGDNRIMADYFTRLSYALSQGKAVADVLVVSSLGSAWCEYKPSDYGPVETVFEEFKDLTQSLLASQIDFEYGEEFLMAKYGSVEDGVLRLGRSRYGVVILPPMKSIKATTLGLLKAFVREGGKAVCVGEKPALIEGEKSEELRSFVAPLPLVENEKEAVSSLVKPLLPEGPTVGRISGASLDSLLIHHRKVGRGDLYFLVNTDHGDSIRLEVDFNSRRSACELVSLTGKVLSCPNPVTIDLAGGEGRLFGVGLKLPTRGRVGRTPREPRETAPITGKWRIRREDPNQAVLDFARWRRPGGKWSKVMPIWQVQDAISALGAGAEFEVRQEFESDAARRVDLVVEDAHKLDVYVNGRKVESGTDSWWLDPSFRRMTIGSSVSAGRNHVVLKGRSDADLSIEDAYLLGDFAVQIRGRKTPLLSKETRVCDDISDLREAGYPFYAGKMSLQTEIKVGNNPGRPHLEFGELGGTVVEFVVNDKKLGKVYWREYAIDAGRALRPGRNKVIVNLANSLRNLLGPRHWEEDESTGVNPLSFRDHHGWTNSYVGTPLGLKDLRIVWR